MKNIAIILAAGSGTRTHNDLPKQFIAVKGKPLLEYSLEAFQTHSEIDEILLVLSAQFVDRVSEFIDISRFPKVKGVIAGGKERYESSLAAVHFYAGQEVNLLLHDAARPLLSQAVISRVVGALHSHEAVCVAIPVVDTIAEIDANTQSVRYPDRKCCWAVQTPQAFSLPLIDKAFRLFLEAPNSSITDDCSVVRQYIPEQPIFFVEGERKNMKVTHPEDFAIVEMLHND